MLTAKRVWPCVWALFICIWCGDTKSAKNHRHSFKITGLVFAKRPRPAVAAHARSLRHLGFRNHAPTDAGQNRPAILGTLDTRTANHPGRGHGASGQNPQALGGPWLLHPRPEPAKSRAANRRATKRPFKIP